LVFVQQITMQTAKFRYVLPSVYVCVCVCVCMHIYREIGIYTFVLFVTTWIYEVDEFSVLQILKRHISIVMHCEYIIIHDIGKYEPPPLYAVHNARFYS